MEKNLPGELAQIVASWPEAKPVHVMFHDEARFERLSRCRYRRAKSPRRPVVKAMREKNFHNRAFDSLDTLEDTLVSALRNLELDQSTVRSICQLDWIIHVISIADYNYISNQ